MISLAIFDLLVLFIVLGVVEGTPFELDQPSQTLELPEARRLSAASLPPNLKARADSRAIALNKEANFDFLHHVPEEHAEYVFAATLSVASQQPILALEDLDPDLNGITCSDSQVQLSMGSISRTKDLKQELEALSDFVIVTSHEGCDIEGERSIHRVKDTVAFFDHGSLEIISNDLFAQVQLGLDLSLSQSLASLNISLPMIPLTPFEIPGVVAFGPIIQPDLTVSVDTVEKIGFSYGFNLSVPNDSKIKINMSEPRNSSISGFADTEFHALPFESTSALASLIFSITFTPQILLGIRTAKGMVSGGIGAFVNLPKVSINATQLSHVNEKCEPVADERNNEGTLTSSLDNTFDGLTHIYPSVDVNMGVLANLQVDVAHFSERAAVQAVLASTSYPLPTACLKFDSDRHTYGVPSKTPSATATSGSNKGANSASSDSDKQSDQLLYPMGHSSQGDEWYDFDNFFEFPSVYGDSNSASVDSISPKDFDLTYNDVDGSNWGTGLDMCTQFQLTDFVNHEAPCQEQFESALNAETVADPSNFLQLPSVSPNEVFVGSGFDSTWLPDALDYDDHFYSTIRRMVESQAAADSGCSSRKEKRREAAIALHLQRLQDTSIPEPDMSSDSNSGFPSPPWSVSRDATCISPATTPLSDSTSKSPTPPSAVDGTPGGIEMVLDLNMNTPANLPRKQKPRSRAQKENYIKVRKHGACEKHRKQHKRCNCLDIAASRINVNNPVLSTTTAALDLRRQIISPDWKSRPRHVLQQQQTQADVLPTAKAAVDRPRPISLPDWEAPSRPILQPNKARTSVLSTNVQTPKAIVRSTAERDVHRPPGDNRAILAPSTLDVHRGRRSPGSLSKPVEVANTGQLRPQVPQSYRQTTPWRGVNQTPSVPGRLMSPTQKSLVMVSKQQSVKEREICPRSAVNHLSTGLPQTITWQLRQVTQKDSEELRRTQSTRAVRSPLLQQSVPTHRPLSVSSPELSVARAMPIVASRELSVASCPTTCNKSVATAMLNLSTSTFSAFLLSMESVVSSAGALFGRFAIFASKQHWFVRKGMGFV
ncbi:hypothetical protein BBP40_005289 [Aspergillus hancockii]|nr:hypothetical protein BBP40_005289 [Aspergillus hancockii]